MKKHELIKFLEPFDDDINVVVRGAKCGPHYEELEYLPFTDDRPAIVVIQLKGLMLTKAHIEDNEMSIVEEIITE